MAAVDELDKPCGERCRYEHNDRCTIYQGRPTACMAYECSWLHGDLPLEMKPSECGLYVETAWIQNDRRRVMMFVASVADDRARTANIEQTWGFINGTDTIVVLTDRTSGDCQVLIGSQTAAIVFRTWMNDVEREGQIRSVFADGVERSYKV